MVAKRVTPSSTFSSITTSAWFNPIWGRAAGALSILTIRAGRPALAPSAGRPVSGITGPVGAKVVAGAVVGGADVVVAEAFFFPPPPQPASNARPTMARALNRL